MNLKNFHILLISLSSALCLLFGGWAVRAFRSEGRGVWLALGALSLAGGLGLVAYVIWFARRVRSREEEERRRRRMIRPLVVVAGTWLLGSDAVPACSVCFGEAHGPMIDAARVGVFLLFGLVLLVQGGFLLFFLHLRRRASAPVRHAPHVRPGPRGGGPLQGAPAR